MDGTNGANGAMQTDKPAAHAAASRAFNVREPRRRRQRWREIGSSLHARRQRAEDRRAKVRGQHASTYLHKSE